MPHQFYWIVLQTFQRCNVPSSMFEYMIDVSIFCVCICVCMEKKHQKEAIVLLDNCVEDHCNETLSTKSKKSTKMKNQIEHISK